MTDFHETLIDAQIQCFGRIAQAFVTYKKQGTYQGNPILGYGKKSIQTEDQQKASRKKHLQALKEMLK